MHSLLIELKEKGKTEERKKGFQIVEEFGHIVDYVKKGTNRDYEWAEDYLKSKGIKLYKNEIELEKNFYRTYIERKFKQLELYLKQITESVENYKTLKAGLMVLLNEEYSFYIICNGWYYTLDEWAEDPYMSEKTYVVTQIWKYRC